MQRFAIRNLLLVIAGSLSLLLGTIGIVLPVVPTTPFLILAALCYLHGSRPLYRRLTAHRAFGRYIHDYMAYRAVQKRTKIVATVLLWASLSFSAWMVDQPFIRLALLGVGVGVTIHIAALKTVGHARHDEEGGRCGSRSRTEGPEPPHGLRME